MLEHTPAQINDLDELLSKDGLATGNTWYHGTTSGLMPSILKTGLIGNGDSELNDRTQATLGTIGGRKFETNEPVFLTQSKALAFYWAIKKAHSRNLYFQKDEQPCILEVTLDPSNVKPDVGGTALIMEPNNEYIESVKKAYSDRKIELPELDPRKLDRMDYLNKLGLGYVQDSIAAENIVDITPA